MRIMRKQIWKVKVKARLKMRLKKLIIENITKIKKVTNNY